MTTYITLILIWSLFFFLHSWLATTTFKSRAQTFMGATFKYYRLIYSIIAFLTLAAVLSFQFSIPAHPIAVSPWIKYLIAIPLGTIGAVVMAICIKKYFFQLSGVQVLYHRESTPTLETGGIHRYIRHPLYTGTLLFIWALCCCCPTVVNLIACTMITIYIRIGISFEEDKLVRIFGRQYRDYRNRTPMLIPGINPPHKPHDPA